jgi:signal transduction histidine kinase
VRSLGDRPIVTRLVLAVAAAMAAVLLAASGFVYWRVAYALDRQLDQDLGAYEQVVLRAVHAGTVPPADTPGETFQVYDGQGRRIAVSDPDDAPRVGPRVLDAALHGTPARVDIGAFLPPPDRAFRVAVRRVATPKGTVVVASAISRRKHDEALRELLLQLAIADLAALAAASFVGYRTARAALDPVEGYRRAVAGVGDDLARRLPVADRDDELTRLGHTFNDLLARLDAGARRERRFLADASHELRSPLSLMRTEIEWALLKPRSDAELHTVLVSLQGQVDRLGELADALLELEELRADGTLAREDVDLAAVVAEVVGRFERAAAQQQRALRVEAGPCAVRLSRRWLELAVSNLVDNALRHGRGTVTVTAGVEGGRVLVTVADEGPGFPEDFAATAFERFSRAEESRTTPGSGLGLALVQAVAEAHGGSATAGGARVVVDLGPAPVA